MNYDSPQSGTTHGVPTALWRSLFHKFVSIVKLDPWSWLGKYDFFGIKTGKAADPVFLHFHESDSAEAPGLSMVYGWQGEGLYRNVIGGIDHAVMRSFEIPIVRAYMRPLESLTPVERDIFDSTGLEPDAKGRVPVFVCYHPGWMPWILNAADAEYVDAVLNQALGVLLRAETDKSIVARSDPFTVWVRAFDEEKKTWSEAWERLHPFNDHVPGLKSMPPDNLIAEVAALPETLGPVEVGLDILPKVALVNAEIVKKCAGGKMPLGYLFTVGDASDGASAVPCLGSNVFYPCEDIAGMWNIVPETLLRVFSSLGRRPREIAVSSQLMMAFLRPLQTRIHFKLTFHEKLPHIDAILERTRAIVDENLAKTSHDTSR